MHDPDGRRGIWFAEHEDKLVVRGGREGDDAWAEIPRSSLPEREFSELLDALSWGAWMQEGYGPNASVVPFASERRPINQIGRPRPPRWPQCCLGDWIAQNRNGLTLVGFGRKPAADLASGEWRGSEDQGVFSGVIDVKFDPRIPWEDRFISNPEGMKK